MWLLFDLGCFRYFGHLGLILSKDARIWDLGFLSRISIARGVYGRVVFGVNSICGCCLILGGLGILGI